MDTNVVTVWSDAPIESFSDAAYSMLFSLEEQMEKEGWDQPALTGVVIGSELGGMGALTVLCPEIPEKFLLDFQSGLATIAATALTAELMDRKEDQSFLDQLVPEGIQGWLAGAEFYDIPENEVGTDSENNPEGKTERRIVTFVDLDNRKYVVTRARGANKAEKIIDKYPAAITRALSVLCAASIMSLIRRDLIKRNDKE